MPAEGRPGFTRPLILITLGWAGSAAVIENLALAGRAILRVSADPAIYDPAAAALLGLIGGFVSGTVLRGLEPPFGWRHAAGLAVGWSLALGAAAKVAVGRGALAILLYPILAGALGGALTGLVLRQAFGPAAWNFRRLGSYVLLWTLSCLLGLLPLLIPPIESLLRAGHLTQAAFWAVAAALGWGLTLRRLPPLEAE
ncbi:MAG: hypothetical protein ACE5MM_06040 [Nitrospiraceae bacterium]